LRKNNKKVKKQRSLRAEKKNMSKGKQLERIRARKRKGRGIHGAGMEKSGRRSRAGRRGRDGAERQENGEKRRDEEGEWFEGGGKEGQERRVEEGQRSVAVRRESTGIIIGESMREYGQRRGEEVGERGEGTRRARDRVTGGAQRARKVRIRATRIRNGKRWRREAEGETGAERRGG
jgi:hypothetical protein